MNNSLPHEPPTPTRQPISHPYPPSYRSQLPSSGSQESNSSPSPSRQAVNPAGYQMEYQQRGEDRHQHPSQASIAGPYNDPYNSRPVDPRLQYPYSGNPPRQGYTINYTTPYGERGPYSQAPSPSPDPRASLHEPLTGRDRSASDVTAFEAAEALRGREAQEGRDARKKGFRLTWLVGKKQSPREGYPEGWTKEDEEAEREYLKEGLFKWKDMRSWRFWIRKEWWCECCRLPHKSVKQDV